MAVDHISSLKAMVWEEAKGKLRAMTMLSGSGHERSPNFLIVAKAVEDFITEFEDNGLQE
jgi:hypothetical protein